MNFVLCEMVGAKEQALLFGVDIVADVRCFCDHRGKDVHETSVAIGWSVSVDVVLARETLNLLDLFAAVLQVRLELL